MLHQILHKLYLKSRYSLAQDMYAVYQQQAYVLVSFLYIANMVSQNILEHKKSSKQENYLRAIQEADFLLPDGIALQALYRWIYRKKLPNHNGTDLTPFLLQRLQEHNIPFTISLYGATSSVVQQAAGFLHEQNIQVGYVQHGYGEFDRSAFIQLQKKDTLPLLLVGRGTPLQELRSQENINLIRQHKLRVMNVGGLFDFRAGAEIRAPRRMRGRLERLRRLINQPSKNARKIRYTLQFPFVIIRYLLLQKR